MGCGILDTLTESTAKPPPEPVRCRSAERKEGMNRKGLTVAFVAMAVVIACLFGEQRPSMAQGGHPIDIIVTHENTSPVTPGFEFAYLNLVRVWQSGSPVSGIYVDQQMVLGLSKNNHSPAPAGPWTQDGFTYGDYTDLDGYVYDIVEFPTRDDALALTTHTYKRDYCGNSGGQGLAYYWNPSPYPACSNGSQGGHSGQYGSLPPP
jgi:hypothetical protein